jgi:predicted phage tail protein
MYTEQLDTIIESLADLQIQMTAFSAIFSGGFFWFALFCVGVVLVLVAVMLYLFVDFFVHLFWRNK